MGWLSMLANPIGEGLGMVRDWLGDKRKFAAEERNANHELKLTRTRATIQRAQSNDASAADLDMYAKQNAGWKDDWLLIITTLPLAIIVFAPIIELFFMMQSGTPYVSGAASAAIIAGLNTLNGLPNWYLGVLGLVYVDTFGFRRMLRLAIEKYATGMADKLVGK